MGASTGGEPPRGALDRAPLPRRVSEVLRAWIESGEYLPGRRIVETEVARELEVSQATVREALRQLAHEGLVLQLPRRGSFVAEISESDARDIYAVRLLLEDLAVRELWRGPRDRLLDELARRVDEMRSAAAAGEVRALVDADTAFHRAIWHASGNAMLARIWPMVEGSMRNLTLVTNRVYFGDLGEIAEVHARLVEALRGPRLADARRLVREHVTVVWSRMAGADGPDPG